MSVMFTMPKIEIGEEIKEVTMKMCAWNGEEIKWCGKKGREEIKTFWKIYAPDLTMEKFQLFWKNQGGWG